MSLYQELKRRNVFRVGAAYVVTAWLVIQVVETIFPAFGFGDVAVRLVVIAFAIGLIPALVLSWVFEITPEGLKKDKDIDRSTSITSKTGKQLDRIIMVVLALALGYFAVDKFMLSPQRQAEELAMATKEAHQEGRTEALVESYGDKSIAVLPFVNMSSDEEQEYFSDGISEELLNLLAKIPELRVISRSSAFSYKGKDIKLAEVAKELNVAHILEGSVRKAGKLVRITAQLIEARSDTHLWSETYDRTLDDIFAIQDEIAATVVAQLKITLLGAAPVIKQTDPQAYVLYLQAHQLRRMGSDTSGERRITLLQQALEIDPDYAAAWSELSLVYGFQANNGLIPLEEGRALAREAVNKALAIDPEYALAHAVLGNQSNTIENDLVATARHLQRALQLEPANTEIIHRAANLNQYLGRLEEALKLGEFVVARDPVNPAIHHTLGRSYRYAGRWDESIASYSTALTLSPGRPRLQAAIVKALLLKGEPQAALAAIPQEESFWRMMTLALAYHTLSQTDESDAALAEFIEQYAPGGAFQIACIYAWRGEADLAFEWLDKSVEYKDAGLSEIVAGRLFSNIHGDPRWLPFLERIGRAPGQLAAIEFKVALPE